MPRIILFDGPPSPDGPSFIEAENGRGKSINIGNWVPRVDGLWELQIKDKTPGCIWFMAGMVAGLIVTVAMFNWS